MDLKTNNINEVMFGFFMDQTDGTTERNSETISNTDLRLHKYGASAFANKNSGGASFISNATYLVRLDSTDVNTPGPLKIICHKTSCLPVMMEFNVLTEAAWADKYGTARYGTASMLTSVQTNVDSVLGTVGSILTHASAVYTLGAKISQLTSVQTNVDSVLGTLNSVKTMTSQTYTYGALTSQLTSVQTKADSIAVVLGSLYGSLTIMSNLSAAAVWAVATRSLTDSVARTSQLTSMQTNIDSTLGTLNSVKLMTSQTYTYGALTSKLTSVQTTVDSNAATLGSVLLQGSYVYTYGAKTSQLTSVQTTVDGLVLSGAALTASQVWEYSNRVLTESVAVNTWAVATRSLTDSVARASQLTSVQGIVDGVNSVTASTYQKVNSVLVSLAALNNIAATDVWGVATRSLTDSVARTSQLTSVQLVVDAGGAGITTSQVWEYTNRTLTDSIARTSQITSVQNTLTSVQAALVSIQASLGGAGGGDATLANQSTIISMLSLAMGSGFVQDNNSLKAIRDRGDAAWTTGGGMAGSNDLTITLHDGGGLNIVEAAIEVYDSAGTLFYERKDSNSSGQAVFHADDGIYYVKVHKAGYSFTDIQVTVSGDTAQTIVGTASVIVAPADPTLCRIGMYIKYQDGAIPTSVTSSLEVIELPYTDDNTAYLGTAYEGTYSNTTGLIYWDVKRESVCRVSIIEAGIDAVKITIPDSATAEIEDLI